MKLKKSYLHSRLIVMFITALLLSVVYFVVFPPWFSIESEMPAADLSSEDLFATFVDDPSGAHYQYGDKVIVIEGVVTLAGPGFVLLGKDMEIVRCVMRKTIYDRKKTYRKGDPVMFKGVCRGLNLTELLVTHCVDIGK
ncbi:MAG: hypothetical protein A2X22_09615 [Bacteroidetes bacterium GWF2_49_14]|nr:MAG: hypothetical protein A2X22_09615 [Bacteroidetes bacterium GWF2_49_14]HBB91898.1 hypothetical protein [Bacteroidales bacterium]